MSKYNELRSQANSDVRYQRGENQKPVSEAYKKNFDRIFKNKYNVTNSEVTDGSNE